jgi:cation-transporting ATPase E
MLLPLRHRHATYDPCRAISACSRHVRRRSPTPHPEPVASRPMTTSPETPSVAEPITGLTGAEVAERRAQGQVNHVDDRSSRTIGEIVRANVFTRFNAIVGVLAVVIVVVGDLRDALFAGVMVSNAVIGIAQELRSKATLDRLTLVAAPKLTVIRDGEPSVVEPDDIVLDDHLVIGPGDQIVVDGTIERSDELSVDESLLTGEADAVEKHLADGVLSGSFVVAGSAVMRATAVGDDAYAAKLAREARKFRRPRSELERGIDLILRVVTWLIVPAGLALFFAQRYGEGDPLRESLVGTVAGLVALVPQGLVLLLSMAQAVAVIRLGRNQVLVQQLQAVETLARVTMLATDKTGTLTTGTIVVESVESESAIDAALAALGAADPRPDATMAAIKAAHPDDPGWTIVGRVPFASAYKFSAVAFDHQGAWYIGAPEVLLPAASADLERVGELADSGRRVLVVAAASALAEPGVLPDDLEPRRLVICADEIRPDAADTIAYFHREQVTTKVISGDNPRTVAAIAQRCGVPESEHWVDARELAIDDSLGERASKIAVFGRVTPEVKRSLVQAAQARGEVVAMTGDGVNDTLALKDADLGIAMGAGTSAARSVAEIVLLDNRFATLPGVVAEGRRVIANIERVARLFVTKTVWAAAFAVLVGIFTMSYPILPRQLTVIDFITIGVPGFVLSFRPSHEPARPGFIRRVMVFSGPIGLVVGLTSMATFGLARSDLIGIDRAASQSIATLVLTGLGLVAVHELMRPLDRLDIGLLAVLVAMAVGAFTIPFVADFFLLERPGGEDGILAAAAIVLGGAAIVAANRNASRLADVATWLGARVRRGRSD